MNMQDAAMPVQPSQVRLYLRSERLVETDGELQDFLDMATFNQDFNP